MTILSHQQAKRFYDAFGSRQDRQAFYEDPAICDLLDHGRFATSESICEFGCGTGRLAATLLSERTAAGTTYLGLDQSQTMVELASSHLRPWAERARVILTDGTPRIPAPDDSFDRVLSTYVLDLLGVADIRALLDEASRVLRPGGLICNAGLTYGQGPLSKGISAIWQFIQMRRPTLVGGCRPLNLCDHLEQTSWHLEYRQIVCSFGICSEICVASVV
jgi:ubiquinone/menaquinone biosynthesis C-methylase UbiE